MNYPSTKIAFIYSLKDPITNEIRYIGKSINPKLRLKAHISGSKERTHKACWIKSLANSRKIPIQEIIQIVELEKYGEREQYWIKYYKSAGYNLTNLTDGGEGSPGAVISEETRKKQKENCLKRPKELYKKIAIKNRIAMKGRKPLQSSLEAAWKANKIRWENKEERIKQGERAKNVFSKEERIKNGEKRIGVKQVGASSKYIGVCKYPKRRERIWAAKTVVGKKHISLGFFHTEVEAAIAYNKFAINCPERKGKLNIIEDLSKVNITVQ